MHSAHPSEHRVSVWIDHTHSVGFLIVGDCASCCVVYYLSFFCLFLHIVLVQCIWTCRCLVDSSSQSTAAGSGRVTSGKSFKKTIAVLQFLTWLGWLVCCLTPSGASISIQLWLVLSPPSSSNCTWSPPSAFLSPDLSSMYSWMALFLCCLAVSCSACWWSHHFFLCTNKFCSCCITGFLSVFSPNSLDIVCCRCIFVILHKHLLIKICSLPNVLRVIVQVSEMRKARLPSHWNYSCCLSEF